MDTINTKAEMFRDELIKLVNGNGLPAALTYYIMKDVFQDLQKYYNTLVIKQKNTEKQEQ